MTEQTQNEARERRGGKRRWLWYAIPTVGTLTVFGAGCELATLLQLLLMFMGAAPAGNFGDSGQVNLNMIPLNEFGNVQFASNALYQVEVTDPPQTQATVEGVESKPSREVGSFAVLLDSSSSMSENDVDRRRVDAAQMLAYEVLDRTPGSRLGMFDFGYAANGDFEHTRTLTAYTSDGDQLAKGAQEAVADGWTPLYDSLDEVLDSMEADVQSHFQAKPVDKAIVVITDGEDNSTYLSLSEVITKANRMEIPIHVIGMAEASEFGANYATSAGSGSNRAISELRRLADDTGGVYASVHSADDLVGVAETIALGLTGGYETATVKLDPVPPPGTLVKGRVKLRGLGDLDISESLAGDWEFVAP